VTIAGVVPIRDTVTVEALSEYGIVEVKVTVPFGPAEGTPMYTSGGLVPEAEDVDVYPEASTESEMTVVIVEASDGRPITTSGVVPLTVTVDVYAVS